MGIFTGIVMYVILYCFTLFMVLPFGNRLPEQVQMGNSTGAPENARIKQKFIITAVVAAVIWLVAFGLIQMDVIDFYDIGRQMSDEDFAK